MRVQRVFATSVLLLLAVVESRRVDFRQLQAFHLRTERKIAQVSASVRAFPLQVANEANDDWGHLLDPASDDAVCQEAGFRELLNSTVTMCSKYRSPISNDTLRTTVVAHRSAWGSYCQSPCVKAIQTNLTGSKYWKCMRPELQYTIAEVDYLCSNKDSSGDVCGLTMSRLAFLAACGNEFTESNCARHAGVCEWSDGELSCGVNATQALLSDLCGSCVSGLTSIGSKYPGVDHAVRSIKEAQHICAIAPSGAYCLPIVASLAASGGVFELFHSNNKTAAFCTDDDMVACFGGFVAVNTAQEIASARESFVMCAALFENRSEEVTQSCLSTFHLGVIADLTYSATVGAICTHNRHTYCLPALAMVMGGEGTGEDSSTCAANATTLEALGCCLGTWQSVTNSIDFILVDYSLLPPIPGYTPPPETTLPPPPPTQEPVTVGEGEELSPNPGEGGLFSLEACGVKGINQTLRVRCAQNRYRVTKNLIVKLDYAAVTANAETKQAVLLSLRRDTAGAAKVSPDQITDDSISATTRVQLTTSSRVMQVQASGAPGVVYKYTMQASNRAQVQAASANVDAAVKTGYLDLSYTRSTVEAKCANCVGSGGAASINQVSSTTTNSVVIDSNGSSTAVALGSAVLAVLLTVLALLR